MKKKIKKIISFWFLKSIICRVPDSAENIGNNKRNDSSEVLIFCPFSFRKCPSWESVLGKDERKRSVFRHIGSGINLTVTEKWKQQPSMPWKYSCWNFKIIISPSVGQIIRSFRKYTLSSSDVSHHSKALRIQQQTCQVLHLRSSPACRWWQAIKRYMELGTERCYWRRKKAK